MICSSRPFTEQVVIPHPTFSNALSRIEESYRFAALKSQAEGTAIVGESGTGKTSVLRIFLDAHSPSRDTDGMRIPVLFVTVPSAPTVKSLAGVILEALHAPDTHRGTENELTRRIRVLMRETGVLVVMIDEFQHFFDRGKQKIMHHVADWLKILIDETRATLIVAGLQSCLAVIDQNEQLARRFGGPIHFNRFDWQSRSDRDSFIDVLDAFQDELRKQYDMPDFTSDEMAFRFWRATGGLMGYLTSLLRSLERTAMAKGKQIITLSDLDHAHMESSWASGRGKDTQRPFHDTSAAKPTVELIEDARRVGIALAPPPVSVRRRGSTAKPQSLSALLSVR